MEGKTTSQAAIAAAYKQMAASRIKTIALERPKVDPIRSGLAVKRIKAAVKKTNRKAVPITSPTKIAAIKAAYTVQRPYTVAAVPGAVLAPTPKETPPVAMLAGIASAALAAAQSPTGQALIGGGLSALGLGSVTSALGLGGTTVSGTQTVYSAAFVKGGRIYVQTAKGWVAKGYTPDGAKKKFRTRPRRKRWTQRDEKEMQWRAHLTAIAAGKVSIAPL